jgi:predicted N-formylglutamate amidohydrolase
VLWDKDPRLARSLIAALAQGPGMIVGDNEPYSGQLRGDSMWRHGTVRGLPHAIVEIRQDLIAGEASQQEWGERLAGVLTGLLAREDVAHDLRRQHHYGSLTD